MRVLVVTEKAVPDATQRDGGARLVESLRRGANCPLDVMNFAPGDTATSGAKWTHRYPFTHADRFIRRIRNASFVASRVREVATSYTHVVFVHVSMQLGFSARRLEGVETCTFPMFLTPCYEASGERVPTGYEVLERASLAGSDQIVTPSHAERRELEERYDVSPERIRVVPRGIDMTHLRPRARQLDGAPLFCSIGSIKPQKDTLRLLRLFARLRLIGPVQDAAYGAEVERAIARHSLGSSVERLGHVPPARLGQALDDAHVHLSASRCETFGRATFEALASGLPAIAPHARNAAAEHLHDAPYARFFGCQDEALDAIGNVLSSYEALSSMAIEVGELFDDASLATLLFAELGKADTLAVSDFDGTLFHKDAPERTRRCVDAFQRFPKRAVCSARPLPELLCAMESLGISADFVIGWSGGVVADGEGRTLWRRGFTNAEADRLSALYPDATRIVHEGETLQLVSSDAGAPSLAGLKHETYQGRTFSGPRRASKLRAVQELVRHIGWRGRVRTFGDGRHDLPLLTYFDGTLIRPLEHTLGLVRRAEEINHD
jgi:glycosyltransferase involved in cell wall biosynthesis